MNMSKSRGGILQNLWFWVVSAFIILISAWTVLIFISFTHKPESVPVHQNISK